MSKCISWLVLVASMLITPELVCWGYDEGEHAAINDWITSHSVGGFDFDQLCGTAWVCTRV